ncbi:hypothetical protein D049_0606B, partial [Vibrio parahaemolyticus VPTS-2010]
DFPSALQIDTISIQTPREPKLIGTIIRCMWSTCSTWVSLVINNASGFASKKVIAAIKSWKPRMNLTAIPTRD